jgi:hypothetical protein
LDVAPLAALPDPLVEPLADGVELLPDAPVELLPDAPLEALPDAPLEALSLEELPEVALGVEDEPALAPLEDLSLEELLCAMETLASAKSAAAVAVPTNLSICTFLL